MIMKISNQFLNLFERKVKVAIVGDGLEARNAFLIKLADAVLIPRDGDEAFLVTTSKIAKWTAF